MTARSAGVPSPRAAFRALTRTFLQRFFDNEIAGGTRDLAVTAFWLMAFLAAPLALWPVSQISRYRFIVLRYGPDALRVMSRPDTMLTFVLGMTAAGLIASIVWSSLMLERRDGLILGAMPVEGRTVVLAKLAALAVYVLGISAAMHVVSSVLFGVVLADGARQLRFLLLVPVAHFAAGVASCAFVFLCVTAVQGLALLLAGPAAFRRISPALQAALVAGIVVAVTKIAVVVQAVASISRPGPPASVPAWLSVTPPAWFLGLYEWMVGNAEPAYRSLAATAVLAVGVVAAITFITYQLVYRRVMVRAAESSEGTGGARWLSAAFDWIARRVSRAPVRRAAAQFYFASIGRVERLRFVVAVMMGVACAWLAPALVAAIWQERSPSPETTFALSYAAMTLAVVGLRVAISMPADLRATWIAPMIDAPRRLLRSGLWRALFVTSVLPATLGFAVIHTAVWGARVAVVHTGLMVALGVLLVEAALWHLDDMSNQRPWRPEHAGLRTWWPAYLALFVTITGALPQLEWTFRDSLGSNAAMAGVLLIGAWLLRAAHRRPYPSPPFEIETLVEAPGILKLD